MTASHCVLRKPWDLAFVAEPRELPALRRITRLHLRYWGLQHLIEDAELCVTELVANVISHVGLGTPAALALSMNGAFLRIEVEDPDLRALPTLLEAADDVEAGRGVKIVAAVTDRWGVLLKADRKVTWCELKACLEEPGGHVADVSVHRAESLLGLYEEGEILRTGLMQPAVSQRGVASKQTAIEVIADLLGWACAHGHDPGEVLDRAQDYFEAATTY
ncbi:ATP-binding protein [Streptomyces sp. YJ-C3]